MSSKPTALIGASTLVIKEAVPKYFSNGRPLMAFSALVFMKIRACTEAVLRRPTAYTYLSADDREAVLVTGASGFMLSAAATFLAGTFLATAFFVATFFAATFFVVFFTSAIIIRE